jgi:hypothetical protein
VRTKTDKARDVITDMEKFVVMIQIITEINIPKLSIALSDSPEGGGRRKIIRPARMEMIKNIESELT